MPNRGALDQLEYRTIKWGQSHYQLDEKNVQIRIRKIELNGKRFVK